MALVALGPEQHWGAGRAGFRLLLEASRPFLPTWVSTERWAAIEDGWYFGFRTQETLEEDIAIVLAFRDGAASAVASHPDDSWRSHFGELVDMIDQWTINALGDAPGAH